MHRASRLLAAAEGIRDRLGTPREPAQAVLCDRVAAARAALGAAGFEVAWSSGRALDLGQPSKGRWCPSSDVEV
jgi:hypothetical protein